MHNIDNRLEIAPDHFSVCLRIQLKEIDLTPAHLPEKFLPQVNG
jgi:hypothetical protein